jgi:MFS family permease
MFRTYGQVALAACLINTSYGTMSYAFSVLVTEQAAGGELGRGTVSTGFALALLVSGVTALGVGTIADLFGTRRLIFGGSTLGALGLVLLGGADNAWQAWPVFALILGPAMAATFYEPIYVLMNRWFDAPSRPRAYGVLTLLGGVSVTIYTPLTQFWVNEFGWRGAMVANGAILLVVGWTVAFFLREPPPGARTNTGRMTFGELRRETWLGLKQTTLQFWLFSAATVLAIASFSGSSFHMIAQLESRGFAAGPVAVAIAVTGLVSLPARLVLPSLSSRTGAGILLALSTAALGVAALVASVASQWWQVWAYVALFGVVFGGIYPLRALALSERFSGPYFGRVIGLQALLVAVARAIGPALVGLSAGSTEGYSRAFQFAAVALFVSAVATWATTRRRRAVALSATERTA